MRCEAKLTAEIGGKRYACVPSENCSGCAFEGFDGCSVREVR